MSTDIEYQIVQDDEQVAAASGGDALNEIKRYAAQYVQDGPIDVYEVTRRLIDLATFAPAVGAVGEMPELPPCDGLLAHRDGTITMMRAFLSSTVERLILAAVLAERTAIAKMVEDQSLDSPAYIAECIRART